MTIRRNGRLSIRLTQDFLDLCSKTADARGLTLTEFTQQALAMNITRKPDAVQERAALIIDEVLRHG